MKEEQFYVVQDKVSSVLPVDEVVDADIAHSCFHFAVHLLHIT